MPIKLPLASGGTGMAETTLPRLLVSREEARQKIQAQIEKGQQLRSEDIRPNERKKAGRERKDWSEDNKTLLLSLFGEKSTAVGQYIHFDNFIDPRSLERFSPDVPSHVKRSRLYEERMNSSINSLEEILNELELYDKPSDVQRTSANEDISDNSTRIFSDKVFIVHGHDNEAKVTVARFVENLGIGSTILDEEVNEGQTIPEKFEEHAGEAGFAIILLTPDDVGASKDESNNPKPRARQNVVLELGYFWGRLGRERMCVLYKEGVELPSDIHGILYVPMDSSDGWQLQLAKEMKQADLPVDLNRLA